jgi:aspartyl protease family protein
MNEDEAANSRIGKVMTVIGFVFGLGLLTLFFQDKLDERRNPNQSPLAYLNTDGIAEVVLERNPQGHYVATGFINGHEVEFLLDTGATDVAVPEHIARAAGLTFGQQGLSSTANGVVTTWNTRIDSLQLGTINLSNVEASILPSMNDNLILLGMSALRQVEFTQQGRELTLRYRPQ